MSGDLLTGRDSELSAIRRALSGAGNYSGVVICGAAGVGKTRLAREVLARAQAAGERTNWITGTESARPLPLGAFTGSITETASESMPDVGRLINSFVAQQRQGRVLIGVDDAHLLDGLSAHVVHQLAQTRGPRLVVTVRTGEAEPDAVTALWKDGLLARLDLEPLSEAGTRSLIESMLEGAVDARSAQRFWKLTGGNALFLRQLVNDQVDAGRMRQVAGVWMWDDRVAVSQSITDMVGRQLGELPEGVALVVDTLSQCEPLAVDVLCKLAERTDLEAAEQMHLVTVERSGDDRMARLAHPLFGELRRASAGEMYLSRIRGKLAQGLSEKPDTDMQSTVRRAMLTLESDLPPDPDLFVDAARFAMTLLDLELADRFASAAVAAGAGEAPGVQAMNLVLRGRGDDAEKFLKEITADGHEDTHRWSTVRAANLIWKLGRPDDASAILDRLAAGPGVAGATGVARSGAGMRGRCVRTLRGRLPKRPLPHWIRRQLERLSLDDGVVRVDDGARRAGSRRRADVGRRTGVGACVDVLPDSASAVLVRRRLCPRMPVDRPHRRLRENRQADGRLGERRSRPRLRQPGIPVGPVGSRCAANCPARSNCCMKHLRVSSTTASPRACGPRPASR